MTRTRDRNGFYPMPPRVGQKACTRCGETKPLTSFSWIKKTGFWHSWCSWCVNHSQGHRCETCESPVSNTGALGARRHGRPVLCRTHGMKAMGERMTKPLVHGSLTGYKKGCRCQECRAASAASRRNRRQEVIAGERTPVSHGTNGAYASGCRCQWCRDARSEYQRVLRRRKRAAA